MLAMLKADLIQVLRNRGVVIWVMAFPILLATVFMFMFGGSSSGVAAEPAPVGVVSDGSASATSLEDVLAALSEGDDPLLAVTAYASEGDVAAAADAGEVCAYVVARDGAEPRMVVPARAAGGVSQSVVQLVLDRYVQLGATMGIVAAEDPAALAAPGAAEGLAAALAGDDILTEQVSVLRSQSSVFTRYYFALLGFSSLMGAQVALLLVTSKRADGSPAGARRQIAARSPFSQLLSGLAASWLVVFVCLVAAFVYIRLAAGVSLGGRNGLGVVACAFCALVSCSVGALIGALPRISTGAKDVICTILTMGLTLPAGLFGEPSQRLGDWLSANVPLAQLANPAVQAAEVFYRLMFYDSLAPFALSLATLAAISAVLLGAAAFLMRRQRYAAL